MIKKLFLLVILLHIIAWLALKPVWPFSDDYCYAYHAHSVLEGNFNLTYNQFQNRFGVFMPAVFIYHLFGTNAYTIALWPLLASCLTITAVYLFLTRITDNTISLISAFLIAVNTLQIGYSITIFPDIIVSLYCIAAILILYYGRQYHNQNIIYPILMNFVLLLGFLTKETILLITPFMLIILVSDRIKKQNTLFWKRTILWGFCSILLLFLIYYLITGDPFFRIKSLLALDNQFLNEEYRNNEVTETIKATYSSNILKWFNSELGYLFIFIFSAFSFFLLIKKNVNDFHSYILIYTIVLLSEYVVLFHTHKYGVLFMQDRLWMITIAPLSILSALTIIKAKAGFYYYLMIVFTTLCLYNFSSTSPNRSFLFGLFLAASILSFFMLRKNKHAYLILLFPFLILSVNFVYSNSNYRVGSLQSGDLIKEQIELLNGTGKKVVLTDDEFAENHIIYNGFKEYNNLAFYPFSKYDSLSEKDLYVIVNNEEFAVPDFIIKDPSGWKKEFDSKKLLIYKREK